MNLPIETEDLGKHYGDVSAVEHLSLRVAEGEIYAFLGLNGAGKTTTIRMLLGMIKPTTGYATVLQTRVRLGSREPWAAVGYLVEMPARLPGADRPREPGGRPPPAPGHPRQAVGQIIERLGLAAYADRRAGTLSQGNAQRLGLAKALLHSPQAADPGRAGQRPGPGRDRRDPRAAAGADPPAGRDGLHVQPHPGRGLAPGRADRDHPPGAPAAGIEHRRAGAEPQAAAVAAGARRRAGAAGAGRCRAAGRNPARTGAIELKDRVCDRTPGRHQPPAGAGRDPAHPAGGRGRGAGAVFPPAGGDGWRRLQDE